MKIATIKNNPDAQMRNKVPLLPLVHDKDLDKLNKTNSMTVELQSQPSEDASPKYKVTVPILKGGELLQ